MSTHASRLRLNTRRLAVGVASVTAGTAALAGAAPAAAADNHTYCSAHWGIDCFWGMYHKLKSNQAITNIDSPCVAYEASNGGYYSRCTTSINFITYPIAPLRKKSPYCYAKHATSQEWWCTTSWPAGE